MTREEKEEFYVHVMQMKWPKRHGLKAISGTDTINPKIVVIVALNLSPNLKQCQQDTHIFWSS